MLEIIGTLFLTGLAIYGVCIASLIIISLVMRW